MVNDIEILHSVSNSYFDTIFKCNLCIMCRFMCRVNNDFTSEL